MTVILLPNNENIAPMAAKTGNKYLLIRFNRFDPKVSIAISFNGTS